MKKPAFFKTAFIFFCLLYAALTRPAYAYLDPGTGSYILQIVIAFLLAGVFVIKACWRKIKNFFAALFSRSKNTGKK
ncbi:MAG TPA: hypothetical protein PKN36_10550 [bacterium]|nr:hypothetical protein [bacterium]